MTDKKQKPNINFDFLPQIANDGLTSIVSVAKNLELKATLMSAAVTIESHARSGLASTLKSSTKSLSSQSNKAFTQLAPSLGLLVMASAVDPESAKIALEQTINIIAGPSPFDGSTLAGISDVISHVKTNTETMYAGIAAITAGGVSLAAKNLADKCKKYIPKISPEYYEKTVDQLATNLLAKIEDAPKDLTEIEKLTHAFDSVLEDNQVWVEDKEILSSDILRGIGKIAVSEHRDEIERQDDRNVSYPYVM